MHQNIRWANFRLSRDFWRSHSLRALVLSGSFSACVDDESICLGLENSGCFISSWCFLFESENDELLGFLSVPELLEKALPMIPPDDELRASGLVGSNALMLASSRLK